MIAGVLGGVLVICVALVISLTTGEKKSAHGCISVSLGYSIGGQTFHSCGAAARRFCAGAHKPGLSGAAGDKVAAECHKAGLKAG